MNKINDAFARIPLTRLFSNVFIQVLQRMCNAHIFEEVVRYHQKKPWLFSFKNPLTIRESMHLQ